MEKTTELLEELRSYMAADFHEAQNLRAVLDLLSYGLAPFSRASFVPGHVTASCFIVDPSSSRVLLHHHRRLNRWLQMGGHIEAGEAARTAALREGKEESGLDDLVLLSDRVFDIDVHPIPAAGEEPDHSHFDVRYLARTAKADAVIADPAESMDLAWIDFDTAVQLMGEESARRVMLKIRKLATRER